MKSEHTYFVYIMTNQYNTVFYTGVTNDLERRVQQHRSGIHPGFTKRYALDKLVYYEEYEDIETALFREKQIKASSRKKKIELINSLNPECKDLYAEIFDD